MSLIPPPTACPISTPTGSLSTAWGNYFIQLGNTVNQAQTQAPAAASYIIRTTDTSGLLSNAQILSKLTAGFVKVSGGTLSSTGNNAIQTADIGSAQVTTAKLATTTVLAGSYGSSSTVATFTVGVDGRLTAAGSTTISGVAPGGSAGGDLSGTYPNPTTAKIQNVAISSTNATAVSNLTGVNTGDQTSVSGSSGSCTGNAATATTATNATNTGTTDDTSTNATMYPVWKTTTTGNLPEKVSSTKLTFNPSTGILTTTGVAAALTGNVTGNCTGSSGSCTGNAATVTTNANLTGGVTSVGNAATVVTNANLTGNVTSVGNATTLVSGVKASTFTTGAGGVPSFSAYCSGSTTLAANGYTKIVFDTTDFNAGTMYDTANKKFLPTTAGIYLITVNLLLTTCYTLTDYAIAVYKNGTQIKFFNINGPVVANNLGLTTSTMIQMNGSTDYLEIYCYNGHATLTGTVFGGASSQYTQFTGVWVSPST